MTNLGSPTDVQAALNSINGQIGHSAKQVDTLTFNPQYPNYVIYKNGGSANQGTLVEDYDLTNKKQFYGWTSHQGTLQNVDVKFRFPMPTDFASFSGGNAFTISYLTGLNAATHNKLDFKLTDVTTSTACASSSGNFSATANTWTTATFNAAALNATCTYTPGDVIEADVTFYADNTASANAEAGQANLTYTN